MLLESIGPTGEFRGELPGRREAFRELCLWALRAGRRPCFYVGGSSKARMLPEALDHLVAQRLEDAVRIGVPASSGAYQFEVLERRPILAEDDWGAAYTGRTVNVFCWLLWSSMEVLTALRPFDLQWEARGSRAILPASLDNEKAQDEWFDMTMASLPKGWLPVDPASCAAHFWHVSGWAQLPRPVSEGEFGERELMVYECFKVLAHGKKRLPDKFLGLEEAAASALIRFTAHDSRYGTQYGKVATESQMADNPEEVWALFRAPKDGNEVWQSTAPIGLVRLLLPASVSIVPGRGRPAAAAADVPDFTSADVLQRSMEKVGQEQYA